MSREMYGGGGGGGVGSGGVSNRSPRPSRNDLSGDPHYSYEGRVPSPHRSTPPNYSTAAPSRRSRSATRTGPSPPLGLDHPAHGGGSYAHMDPHGAMEADRRSGSAPGSHHRSRSQSRGVVGRSYHSLDREAHDREFLPIRDSRDRSMERGGPVDMHSGGGHMARRDRSLDRGPMLEEDLYRDHHSLGRSRASPNPDLGRGHAGGGQPLARDSYFMDIQAHNNDLTKELGNLKKELEMTNQKLGSSMHSIKTFWSPELKKERALRKEESAKYSLINDQLKLLNSENQKQAMLVRQLEEELRMQKMRGPSVETQQQLESLMTENEHFTREIAILRETIKELELRIETQKQTLAARDESIKKLLEMLQAKGIGDKMTGEQATVELDQTRSRLLECQNELENMTEALQMKDREMQLAKEEVRAANERLRRIQNQENGGVDMAGGPILLKGSKGVYGSQVTLSSLLDTKDARILSLEREVGLLEGEVTRLREVTSGSRWGSRASLVTPPPPSSHSLPTEEQLRLNDAQERERKYKAQLEESRAEMQKRDQDILAMSAKMKTLEEQHQDYQRHIMVLKESLCAKEEHYNMLQADVEELRQRLEEKNKTIEKKTQQALQATQERNRLNSELNEIRDHNDIKDRKINVLQRKLDLHEANQKLQNGARPGEDMQGIKRQLDEQMRAVESKAKNLEQRNRQLDEREKTLTDLDNRLKSKREQLDNLEAQLAKAHAADGAPPSEANQQLAEMRKALGHMEQEKENMRKALEKAKQDSQSAQSETERLLQVMQMGQEEHFAKDKTIKELQDALKSMRQSHPTASPAKPEGSAPTGVLPPATAAKDAAAAAAEKAAQASEAAKATFEQAKTAAQELSHHGKSDENDAGAAAAAAAAAATAADSGARKPPSEIELVESEGRERENQLHLEQLEVDLKLKDSLICSLGNDNQRYKDRVEELEEEVKSLEEELKKIEKMEELEELLVVVKTKNDRIEELEEALRQSVRIATDMEMEKKDEEDRRIEITGKLTQLEKRMANLQNAHNLRCSDCRPVKHRLNHVQGRLNHLLSERRHHLEQLFDMKHEALTATLSEKDAHIALLEVGGVRSARQAQELDNLKLDRSNLLEAIKNQSEERVRHLQEFAAVGFTEDSTPPASPIPSDQGGRSSEEQQKKRSKGGKHSEEEKRMHEDAERGKQKSGGGGGDGGGGGGGHRAGPGVEDLRTPL